MDKDVGELLLAQGVDEDLWTKIQQLESARKLVEEGKIKVEVYEELKKKVISGVEKKKKKVRGDKHKVSRLTQFASFFRSHQPEKKEAVEEDELPEEKRPILEGWLFKRVAKGRRGKLEWKKRWCVLYQHALVLYHKQGDKNPAGSIIINGEWFAAESKPENAEQDSSDSEEDESTSHASSLQKLDDSQQHQFILSDLNTKHRFAGETEETAVLWVKTLTAVLRSLYQKESNGSTDPEFVGAPTRTPEQIKK